MVGIEHYIFGYRILSVGVEDRSLAADLILRAGVTAGSRAVGEFIIAERHLPLILSRLDGRVRYSISEPRGIPGKLALARRNIAVVISAAVMVVLFILSGEIVWDVRISGNESLDDESVIAALDAAGLGVGDTWRSFSKNEVETRLLSDFRDISWISINRRGTVAYVEVIERAKTDESDDVEDGYYSIVSDVDCVIESITVAHGRAVVSVGDSVRRGDVLISGVVENERGYELVRAEGNVVGRCSATVSAEVGRIEGIECEGEEYFRGYRIKIFGISLNILKNSRNLEGACDIIEKEIGSSRAFGKRLPIAIVAVSEMERKQIPYEYSDAELPEIAAERLNENIRGIVGSGDLVSVRTSGEYCDVGYIANADISYSKSIGIAVRIGGEKAEGK